MAPSATLISLLAGVSVAYLVYRQFRPRRQGNLPPGPRGYPLIGNLLNMAKDVDLSWIMYSKWSKVHGEIVHHEVLGHHTIVLNSQKALQELLDNRSQNYSDRPDMPMVMDKDLMNTDCLFGFFRYSDWWRAHRKTFYQGFQARVLPEYYDIQRAAAASLMEKLTISPEKFLDHVQYYSGSVILKIVYGYTMQETVDDPYLQLVLKAGEGVIAAANHGSFWVDYFPFLKYIPSWMPGAGFKLKAEKWKQCNKDLRDEPYSWVKKALDNGTAVPSFCTKAAETLGVTPGDGSSNEIMIKNCAANAYVGGADTIYSSVATFILAMTLHPEFQAPAQKEIDALVGYGRAPDFADRDKLPFVNALIKEITRWKPVVPSPPHRATKDDVYEGYTIPAGSTIVANSWSVLHDEKVYGADVAEFNPMRFVNPDKDGNFPPDPACFAFGYGRRICPGKDFGQNATYLGVVSLLSKFTIAKALDKNGKEIVPEVEYNNGLISYPKPFQCQFIPRSAPV